MLAIPESEEKLAPLLIFKAKEGKDTEKKIAANRMRREKVFLHSDKKMHRIVKI